MTDNPDRNRYQQQYEIPLSLTLAAFTVEYAGCGSHSMEVQGTVDLEEAQRLIKVLEALPGIREIRGERA